MVMFCEHRTKEFLLRCNLMPELYTELRACVQCSLTGRADDGSGTSLWRREAGANLSHFYITS